MSFAELLIEHRGAVSWLYLNRPKALNAMSAQCMREFTQALVLLRDRAETRVIVVSGKGRAFCAGADIGGAPSPNDPPSAEPTFLDIAEAMEDVLNFVPKPVIAAVNGICCGGGFEIAMMCDFIFAAKSARLGDVHANVGAMPGAGSTARLARIVGPNLARYIMFTGEMFPAPYLSEIGLVTKVMEDDQLESETQAIAEKIAEKSPLSLKRLKMLIGNAFDLPMPLAAKMEKLLSASHMRSWDAQEGGKAFMEKRKPQFRGY